MARLRSNAPLKIALAYAVVAGLWIVFSDSLFAIFNVPAHLLWIVNISKGLGFVAVTGILLYQLTRELVGRHEASRQRLAKSELQLKLALEASGDGFWDWDLASDHVQYSERALEIFGYAPGAIAPSISEWQQRVHPEDQSKVRDALQRQMDGRSDTEFVEHRIRCADGTYRWAQTRGRVVQRSPDGRPLRLIGLVSDISDRKAARTRLEEELALNRTLLQASPVGIISYLPDGQAFSANEAAARIVGCSVADLLGQNFREIPAARQYGLTEKAEEALASGQTIGLSTEYVSTFGRHFWMVGTFSPFTFRGERRLLFVFEDVTEQHRTSLHLNLLESAIEAATEIGWMATNAEGKITWVNSGFTRITGYTEKEAVGRNPGFLKSGKHPPEFYRNLWDTIKRGEVWSDDVVNRRKDGSLYTQRSTIAPVRAQDGTITNFVAITHDISTQKALEEQVNRTQRLESIGMLASGVAHDLNNILAPILMSIELLKIQFPDPNSQERLNIIESTAQRGAGIVRQVLTFARGMEGERIEIQPRHLLRDIQNLIQETFPRSIEMRLRIADGIPSIVGDATQLHQVLLNLAINARDAMPQGGILTLGANSIVLNAPLRTNRLGIQSGTYVALTVTDTGVGMPPEVSERVFEPFFTTKVRGKGTGLGLSTVYGIVRSHEGAIEVESRIGAGSTFTVYLPTVATPSARSASSQTKTGVVPGNGRRILVVDDEEPIRQITSSILEHHGYIVETAVDGKAGQDRFATRPYDVVILDLMMPRMNGADLARAIRATHPDQPIIGSSGAISETHTRSGLEPEWDERTITTLLRKPYTEGELLEALGKVLSGRTDSHELTE